MAIKRTRVKVISTFEITIEIPEVVTETPHTHDTWEAMERAQKKAEMILRNLLPPTVKLVSTRTRCPE